MNKEYDLVCSLGGNCSAAHNLLYRNMRHFSLPFDWLYIKNETPIYKLSECFKNDFKDFCLKENLQHTGRDNKEHQNKFEYFDNSSNYYFANHFEKKIEDGGYEIVKDKLDRRIKRLYEYIEKSNNILFILSIDFELNDLNCIINLKNTLNEKWKNKNFYFYLIMFNCKENINIEENNIFINKYTRDINLYDFNYTNFEWSFLDDIKINIKTRKKERKLFSISFLKYRLKLILEKRR